jgi:hypothetical protein
MEFSKKIVVWAICVTTIYIIISLLLFYIKDEISPELTDLIAIIVTGVIVSYAGKAGVENYQKIKVGKCEELEEGSE